MRKVKIIPQNGKRIQKMSDQITSSKNVDQIIKNLCNTQHFEYAKYANSRLKNMVVKTANSYCHLKLIVQGIWRLHCSAVVTSYTDSKDKTADFFHLS